MNEVVSETAVNKMLRMIKSNCVRCTYRKHLTPNDDLVTISCSADINLVIISTGVNPPALYLLTCKRAALYTTAFLTAIIQPQSDTTSMLETFKTIQAETNKPTIQVKVKARSDGWKTLDVAVISLVTSYN